MVALLLTTTISCSDALAIVNRITNVVGLTKQQKIELIQVVRQYVPSCPVRVIPNERPKSDS